MEDCDMDELFEIPLDLIVESVDLSQYCSKSLLQTCQDTLVIKEPLPTSHLSPISHTSAPANASLLQILAIRQNQTSTPILPMLSDSE
jgi:hypothetical protein